MGGATLNRQDATGVFREIVHAFGDLIDFNFVSITDSNAQTRMKSTGYEIYIKCAPNQQLKQRLMPIVAKHELKLAEPAGAIIIYRPK